MLRPFRCSPDSAGGSMSAERPARRRRCAMIVSRSSRSTSQRRPRFSAESRPVLTQWRTVDGLTPSISAICGSVNHSSEAVDTRRNACGGSSESLALSLAGSALRDELAQW